MDTFIQFEQKIPVKEEAVKLLQSCEHFPHSAIGAGGCLSAGGSPMVVHGGTPLVDVHHCRLALLSQLLGVRSGGGGEAPGCNVREAIHRGADT